MENINRIHLAKVPYEIGISAQAELSKYLNEIRHELDADLVEEIMTDIEVRLTEILSDRNIKRNDVITTKDIDAVKEQLGLPEQFNDSETKGTNKNVKNDSRKLLRDVDNGLLGGVATGLGAYLHIDSAIIRVAFVLLTFLSGFGILLYVLLWLLVPAAKTNSDKLQMRGEKVTAEALQRYRNTAERTIANLRLRSALVAIYVLFKAFITFWAVLFIAALLVALGWSSTILYTQPIRPIYIPYHLNYLALGLIWLSAMSIIGLVIVTLLMFWQHRSASLKIAFVAFLSVTVVSLAGLGVVTPFIVNHYRNIYGGNKLAVALPVHNDNTVAPNSLNIYSDNNLDLTYYTTNKPMHASYQDIPGMKQPNISIVSKNGIVTVQTSQLNQVSPNCVLSWCSHLYSPVKVTLYGPALQKYTVNGGAELDIDNFDQSNITFTGQNNANININNGYSDNMTLAAYTGATISTNDSSAQTANITVQNDNSSVDAPAMSTLNAVLPVECDQNTLLFLGQAPLVIKVNGQSVTNQEFYQNNCVNIANDNAPNMSMQKQTHRNMIVNPTNMKVPNVPAAP